MPIPIISRAEHYELALRRIEYITMHTSNDHEALVGALNLISKVADDAVLGPVKPSMVKDAACTCGSDLDGGHLSDCPVSPWMQARRCEGTD
jgi:hypothetical protein